MPVCGGCVDTRGPFPPSEPPGPEVFRTAADLKLTITSTPLIRSTHAEERSPIDLNPGEVTGQERLLDTQEDVQM